MQSTIVIEDGEVRAIYADKLMPYIEAIQAEFGLPPESLRVNRATRVEYFYKGPVVGWFVDLSPMGGPVCYVDDAGNPFTRRQAAIDFELRWLAQHWLKQEAQDAGAQPQKE